MKSKCNLDEAFCTHLLITKQIDDVAKTIDNNEREEKIGIEWPDNSNKNNGNMSGDDEDEDGDGDNDNLNVYT